MLDQPVPVQGRLEVAGCPIRYRRWALAGAPTVVLVHGSRAHGGWWTEVAPALAHRFDVVVPDLSGHGDSGQRARYTPELWAQEVASVITEVRPGAATVVGHSMGGKVGLFTAALHPAVVEGLVLVDTTARAPRPDDAVGDGRQARKRCYPSLEEALGRFRLRPPGTAADPALLRRVARESLTQVDGGWTWKFDPPVGRRLSASALHALIPQVRCPVAVVYGQHSALVGPDTVTYLRDRLGRDVPAIEVAGAHHHVPLDAPDACRRAIEDSIVGLSG